VPESRSDPHQRRMSVRGRRHHARASSDLTNIALEWIIRAQLPPIGAGVGAVGQRLADFLLEELRGGLKLHSPAT
jgi:hypothetical protein